MKLSFVLFVAAATTLAAADETDNNLRRRLIDIDPDWAPPQDCDDGEAPPHELEVQFKTDNYPGESMFWISPADEPMKAVMKHSKFNLKKTLHSLTTMICDGDYKGNVKDTYGDGICCGYGQGYYKVILDGEEIHEGGGGPNGGGEDGEFDTLSTFEFTAESEPEMPPQDFYGWDGRACARKNGKKGEEGTDYSVYDLDFEDCMHKACTKKKYRGLEYVDDECRIWTTTPNFKTSAGSLCFARKYSYAK